jgi:light-regulated signal transduction histidine kinase (bacteriophytochrome)
MNNSFIAAMNSNIQRARAGLNDSSAVLCKDDLVDLGRLLQAVFEEQQQRVAQLQTIVRCDSLPRVHGKVQTLLTLFRSLVGLILSNPPKQSKLFIYIKCERIDTDIIDMTLPDGFGPYLISFYTNSNPGPEWETANSDTLAQCQQLMAEGKGTLTFPSAQSAGCLFALNLLGKIN